MAKSAIQEDHILIVIEILRTTTKSMPKPMVVTIIDEIGRDPFVILISCLLSLRTRDTLTLPVCRQLFSRAISPQQLLNISLSELERLIYPVGFYHQKAKLLHQISRDILERFHGIVPQTEKELLSIKGIGRKTAALVLGEAFGIPALCVDTHVHRISNRLGIIKTKNPSQTERALKNILPAEYWIEWNRLLVTWGQNICVPISPFCSKCAIFNYCERIGVTRNR